MALRVGSAALAKRLFLGSSLRYSTGALSALSVRSRRYDISENWCYSRCRCVGERGCGWDVPVFFLCNELFVVFLLFRFFVYWVLYFGEVHWLLVVKSVLLV